MGANGHHYNGATLIGATNENLGRPNVSASLMLQLAADANEIIGVSDEKTADVGDTDIPNATAAPTVTKRPTTKEMGQRHGGCPHMGIIILIICAASDGNEEQRMRVKDFIAMVHIRQPEYTGTYKRDGGGEAPSVEPAIVDNAIICAVITYGANRTA